MNTISRAMLIVSMVIGMGMAIVGVVFLLVSLYSMISLPPVADVNSEEGLEVLLSSWQTLEAATGVGAIGMVWGAFGAGIIAFVNKVYK